MAKCRIGHFVEAQILQALEIDYIDESEVLTPADLEHHVDKWDFTVPFVCGCTNLGEALRRIAEGAAMIRTKGEAGTGDIVNAVTPHALRLRRIRRLQSLRREELYAEAKELQRAVRPRPVGRRERAASGRDVHRRRIATPADAALCMQLGADGVFVGSGIFKSGDPASAPARSSRRRRTTSTPTCSRASRPASASRWSASRPSARPERAARDPRLVAPPPSVRPVAEGRRPGRSRYRRGGSRACAPGRPRCSRGR